MSRWTVIGRGRLGELSGAVAHLSLEVVARFNAAGTFRASCAFTPDAWNALSAPRSGLVFYRYGAEVLSGITRMATLTAGSGDPAGTIEVTGVSDEAVLADTLVYPDPAASGTAQTTVSHWTATGPAETVILALVEAQLGPAALPERRVQDLVVAPSQGLGATVTAQIRYGSPDLLAEAARLALAGGDLGVRVRSQGGQRTVQVYQPRDQAGRVRFGLDLGNVEDFSYRLAAPSVTYAIAAGQGELAARLQRDYLTADPDDLLWDRREAYVDRRDTADLAELDTAAAEAVTAGAGSAQVSVTGIDSPVAAYGTDYDLGDKVTVHIGPRGHSALAEVTDLVREIRFTDEPDGERITPAIGPPGTATGLQLPSTRQLREIQARLATVERGQ